MNQSFGQLLKNIRREKGVSQRDLADQVGVDFSYISKIENDRMPPPAADTIIKIAHILEVSEGILLANSKKISTDMSNAISSSPSAIKFINEVQHMGLSDNEWERLTQSLKKLR
jgi:transcriptional regulator with XRE-family HTH domain